MSPAALAPVIRLAPAKLNLTLSVGPLRPDGYHGLHSVMVPLALADRLSVSRAHGPADSLHVTGSTVSHRADDLVLRGFAAARTAVGRGVEAFPLAARLEKRIPVAAGLGGGSSDAAAALEAAFEAWGAELAWDERLRAASSVGSDVAFFLAGGPALVEGRGERVTPLALPRGEPPGILIVTPALGVRTPEIFGRLDAGGEAVPADPRSTRATSEHLASELRAGLRSADLLARAGVLTAANDLANATAVAVPALRTLRRALARLLGRPVGQSGSGPTLWALYPSLQAAEGAVAEIQAALGDGRLTAPGSGVPLVHATTIAGRIEP
jgi:4-diphosphocytidyl-2-C-methyl-D-erythritol kinase